MASPNLFQRPDFRIVSLHTVGRDLIAITTHGALSRGRWLRLGAGINRVSGSVTCKDGLIMCQMSCGEIVCINEELRVVSRTPGAPPGKCSFPPSTGPDGSFVVVSDGDAGLAVYDVDGMRKLRTLEGLQFALLNRPQSKPALTVSNGIAETATDHWICNTVSMVGHPKVKGALVRTPTTSMFVAFDGSITSIEVPPNGRLLPNGWIKAGTVMKNVLNGIELDLGTTALSATQAVINDSGPIREAILGSNENEVFKVSIPNRISHEMLSISGLSAAENSLPVKVVAEVSDCPRPNKLLGCKSLLCFVNSDKTVCFDASSVHVLKAIDLGIGSEETVAVGDCDGQLIVITRRRIIAYNLDTYEVIRSLNVGDIIDGCVTSSCVVVARQGELAAYDNRLCIMKTQPCSANSVRIADTKHMITASSRFSITLHDPHHLKKVTSVRPDMWVTDHFDQSDILAVCYGFGVCDVYSKEAKDTHYASEPIRLQLGCRPLRIIKAWDGKFLVAGEQLWVVDAMGAYKFALDGEIQSAALIREHYVYIIKSDSSLKVVDIRA